MTRSPLDALPPTHGEAERESGATCMYCGVAVPHHTFAFCDACWASRRRAQDDAAPFYMRSKEPDRDWVQDFSHENGNYICFCYACDKQFMGHKRRTCCKLCSGAGLTAADMEAQMGRDAKNAIHAAERAVLDAAKAQRAIAQRAVTDDDDSTECMNWYNAAILATEDAVRALMALEARA